MSGATLHIAVVGAGPAGCYLADALGRKRADARIDIFDRLPTPFGLLRGGVAPDHQGTKNVARQFERTLGKEGVRFFGNVAIGTDLSVDELRENYDVVVFACGALVDKRLGIPGEALDGVYGAGAFVAWYNGIPSANPAAVELTGNSLAIVGNGNVALDIARLLAKTPDELATSDLAAHARAAFACHRLTDIWLIGRRGAADASFSAVELAELGELARATPVIAGGDLPAEAPATLAEDRRKEVQKNLDVLQRFAALAPDATKPLRIHLLFNAAPVAIHGDDRATELEIETTRVIDGRAVLTGERRRIPAHTVVAAIGYRGEALPSLPFDDATGTVRNDGGRIAPGLYAAGWYRRGAQGVVPANRADALAVADLVLADLATTPPVAGKTGGDAILPLLRDRGIRVVDVAGWRRIDSAETAAGQALGRPREKCADREELLRLAEASVPDS